MIPLPASLTSAPTKATPQRSVSGESAASLNDSVSSFCSFSSSICGGSSHHDRSRLYDVDADLEELAESFQTYLKKHDMIQDRKTVLLLTVPNCFTGSQAVTVLQQLMSDELEDESIHTDNDNIDPFDFVITREDAIKAGNDMMRYFNFFKHASGSNYEGIKTLEDSETEFYQFHYNLPCQVRAMKRRYPSYWDKMRLLEQHVQLADRRHLLRVFPNCFVAREAVDVLMDLKLVKCRKEAVHLIGKLNQKVHCCEHVTNEHEFKDEYLFFTFIAPHERMPEPKKKKSKSPKRSMSGDGGGGRRSHNNNKDRSTNNRKDKDGGSRHNSKSRSQTKSPKPPKVEERRDSATSHTTSTCSSSTLTAGSSPRSSPRSSPAKTGKEIKQVNQKRADDIKQRLANYHQDRITNNNSNQ